MELLAPLLLLYVLSFIGLLVFVLWVCSPEPANGEPISSRTLTMYAEGFR